MIRFNWTKLSSTEFEDLCKDILRAEGFENVRRMSSPGPGDMGRDLVAEETVVLKVSSKRLFKFLVQCKNYARSKKIGPNEVEKYANRAETFGCNSLLIIASSDLTSQAKLIAEKISEDSKRRVKIDFWTEADLVDKLIRFPRIQKKYFGPAPRAKVEVRKTLDLLDLKILDGLGIYGPRNLASVARKLNVPIEILRSRVKSIPSRIFSRFYANIYHTNLGLKNAVVFANATPGYEEFLFHCLRVHPYWIYVSRGYGMSESCYGIYTIPNDHSREFESFITHLENLEMSQRVQLIWSTCFHTVHSKSSWFDEQSETWHFPWDKWVEEITLEKKHLPYTLIDPEDFPVKGDEIDIFILKELEKNPIVSFVELAKMLRMSQQLVRYHYKKHILKRGLIESFEVLTLHFDPRSSDMFFFVFQFSDMEKLSKFANSLLDKPFVICLGKSLGENAIIAQIYLPRLEFRRFIDSLSQLVNMGLLQSYQYVILDIRRSARQTISYEYFKDQSWIYNHKKHVEDLQDMVEHAK